MKKHFIIFCIVFGLCCTTLIVLHFIQFKGSERLKQDYDLDALCSIILTMLCYLSLVILFYHREDLDGTLFKIPVMVYNYICYLGMFAMGIVCRFSTGLIDALALGFISVFLIGFVGIVVLAGKNEVDYS